MMCRAAPPRAGLVSHLICLARHGFWPATQRPCSAPPASPPPTASCPTARPHADRIVAAVCHGVAGLLGVEGQDGKPVVAGRTVAGFTEAEEEAVGAKGELGFGEGACLAARRACPFSAQHDQRLPSGPGRRMGGGR